MVNLAIELSKRGHEITFFIYYPENSFESELQAAEVPVVYSQKPSRFSWRPALDLRRLYRQTKVDGVLSYLKTPNIYAILSRWRLPQKPCLVISERSARLSGRRDRAARLIEQLYRYADHLVANSHHRREYFFQTYPWLRDRLSTIWNGFDLTQFEPPFAEPELDTLKLLAVGNVRECKNGTCLIHALAILRDHFGVKAEVSWVGKYQNLRSHDAAYQQLLDSTLIETKTADCWHWLGQRDDIPQLLRTHHALVHPSYLEGLPNVVCEALSTGRPVITTNMLDHPRLVQDGQTGFLFDWQKPESLAEALAQFYRLSESERAEMGRMARTFAEGNLSIKQLGDEYEQLFAELTGV